MTTSKTETPPAEAPAADPEAPIVNTAEQFIERLKNVAFWLCDVEGYCDTAPSRIFRAFSLGRLPIRDSHSFEIEVSVPTSGGEPKILKRSISGYGYTKDNAFGQALQGAGFGKVADNVTLDDAPDPANDTDEVKELKERARRLAIENNGNISKGTLNKYLRYLGIEELPAISRYTFHIPVEKPPVLTYHAEAETEEEARAKLQVSLERDNRLVRQGGYRERLSNGGRDSDLRYAVAAGDPVLATSEVIG